MTRRDGRLLLFLVAFPATLFLAPLFAGGVHYMGDVMRSFQPWLALASQEIQAGRLPLWNPYSACGEPLLANPQVMVLFPPAALFWLFPFAEGWRLFFLFNQALLVAAAFLLFRRSGRAGAAFGATALAWGGFTLIHWEFPGALATLPFAVLFLLLAARRAGRWALPFATALLFTAGYTQFAYYAVLTGGAFATADAFRRKDARGLLLTAAAVAAGLALASPQILSSWEIVRQSIRTGLDAAQAREHLLTPVFLLKFVIPDLYDKAVSPYRAMLFDPKLWPLNWNWLTTYYLGAATPALAAAGGLAAGRRRKTALAWIAAGGAAALVALGVEPVFSLLREGVPGMRYMTHFANVLLIALIALSALAAEGLSSTEKGRGRTAAFSVLGACALAAAAHASFPASRAWTLGRMLGIGPLTAAQDAGAARAAGGALLLCAAAGALFFLKRGRGTALILFLIADLWRFGHDLQPTAPDDFYRQPVPLARTLQGRGDRFSIDPLIVRDNARPLDGATAAEGYQSLRQALFPNMQAPFRIHQTWAYEVFPNRLFTDVRHALRVEDPFGPTLDFLGARHILTTRRLPPPAVYRGQMPNVLLYENPGALARVTWVPSARIVTDRDERLRLLAGAWNPRREALLEEGAGGTAGGTVEGFRWEDGPGRASASGRSQGGWLVYSQIDYPGWEAYVNGTRTPLLRADHAFQAMKLPPGDWRADFVYRPRLLPWGLGSMLLTLLGMLAAGALRLRSYLETFPR